MADPATQSAAEPVDVRPCASAGEVGGEPAWLDGVGLLDLKSDAVLARWSDVYAIRTFRADDGPVVRNLYIAGLLGGQLASNDTGLDIDDVASAYLSDPHNHFWVACVAPGMAERAGCDDGTVVAMIGVQHHDEGVGEIRRLRVDECHRRRRLGSRLLDTAVRFCRDTGCLKVALDTFVERAAAVSLFERHRFRHGRTRKLHGKDTMYFYLDLYAQTGENGKA